jgi:formate transporter
MFYLPCAAIIDGLADAGFWAGIAVVPLDVTLLGTLRVLLPVTAGNIFGGGILVALMYWFIYLRPERQR